MQYATPAQLIDRFDAQELAQVSVPKEHVSIDAALLKLTVTAGDRSSYTADEIAAADAALVKINRALSDASGVIDSRLETRYQLPLSSVSLILEQYCCDIARYNLYDDHATDHITKRYDDAVQFLNDVSEGKKNLGIDENNNSATPEDDVVDFTEGSNVFDRKDSTSFI